MQKDILSQLNHCAEQEDNMDEWRDADKGKPKKTKQTDASPVATYDLELSVGPLPKPDQCHIKQSTRTK
jgi:hypothetical protein